MADTVKKPRIIWVGIAQLYACKLPVNCFDNMFIRPLMLFANCQRHQGTRQLLAIGKKIVEQLKATI